MTLTPLVPRLRSFKFAPFAVVALFLFTNFTGLLFNIALAPSARASANVDLIAHDENYIPSDVPTSGDRDLDLIIFRAGKQYGVDPRLLHAVIWQESKYKVQARSHAGAQGLMQMIPATARRFGCADVHDPADNVQAGTRYLRFLLKRFNGNVSLALAGYNAGEGSVDKYDGIPPYNETQNYVRIITGRYGKTFHPLLTPEEAVNAFHLTQEIAQLQTPTTQQ
ncbi:MAG TPA: lytic transglycosylase domain-containing protein [Pyrinomonadaceae bacterium]|jgi:soluble lytic murein transglycosylase-like protein|nr:lytic transglycosylase domain-containing protein [Pyrinomonadaceae bacterium]